MHFLKGSCLTCEGSRPPVVVRAGSGEMAKFGIAGRSRLLQHHVLMRRVPVGGGSVPRSLEPLPVSLDFR